jgi:N-acetylneuraminic acid mutarotase
MRVALLAFLAALTVSGLTAAERTPARDLSFAQRVAAQEAIERVYYAHQVGTSRPFGEIASKAILERKVRDYLGESAYLARVWGAPITRQALAEEWRRIERNTRFPDRLREVYAALGDDTFVIEECFVRPSLADRLAGSWFAQDQRVHSSAREEAETLRSRLLAGGLRADDPDEHRVVVEGRVAEGKQGLGPDSREETSPGRGTLPVLSFAAEEFIRWRARAPEKVGEVGPLIEDRESFRFQVVLREEKSSATVATYTVAKKSWDAWWAENGAAFQELSVPAVASASGDFQHPPSLALAGASGSSPAQPGPEATMSSCLQAYWDNGSLGAYPDPRARLSGVWTGSLMVMWGGDLYGTDLNTGLRYDPLTDSWSTTSTLNAPTARRLYVPVWTGSEMIVWGGIHGSSFPSTGARYNPATDSWTTMTTVNAPPGRYRHTAVWTGTEMIVYGGSAGTGGRYNPATDTWTPISNGVSRYYHSAVWTGSAMLVWGGSDGSPLNLPSKYDPLTDTWTSFSTAGQPTPRSQHGAVWTGSKMIIWGGTGASGWTATGGIYDPSTDTWTATSTVNAPTTPYGTPASFWTGSLMLAYNGAYAKRFDPGANQWTSASLVNNPALRSDYAAVWTGSQMILWGGMLNSDLYRDTGARYDFTTDAWTPTSTFSGPSTRLRQTAVWTGTQMIVWGGRSWLDGPALDTGGRYDPLLDSWNETSTVQAPAPRDGHTAVWTGSEMIIWGGTSSTTGVPSMNTGGRYDPTTDQWSAVTLTGAPSARFRQTAVWTGNRMVVWGGTMECSPYTLCPTNTGGRYNPQNDSWSAVTTAGAPESRSQHTAVWTGSRMIVWGGLPATSGYPPLITGGRYNPQNDSWSATSTVNAPGGRTDYTALWTGNLMLIWGGINGHNGNGTLFDHTGGRYDPVTDHWSSLSTNGAPRERRNHTAVWTGTEMVVSGGLGPGSFLDNFGTVIETADDTGGRYDPATDTWRATPAAGAPAARYGHSAVWTGGEMILWGGQNALSARYSQLPSGGRLRFGVLPDQDADQDGFSACAGDCDDSDPAIHPGAAETCNQRDDNCAGGIDETFDADQDGYASCPEGFLGSFYGDCDDANPAAHPGAVEICNHVDEDCILGLDDGFPDADADSWAACLDCNDANPWQNPGGTESCDGLDNDCDGATDEGGDALCASTCSTRHCSGTQGCQGPITNYPAGTWCAGSNPCFYRCNGAGSCIFNPVVCTAPDVCQDPGVCDSGNGLCSTPTPNTGRSCDDGNYCTLWEVCTNGVCGGGTPKDGDFDAHLDPACGGDDCDDGNGRVWHPAAEVTNLVLAGSPAGQAWDSQSSLAGPETVYDLVSGALSASGTLDPSPLCLVWGTSETSALDPLDPAAGTGFWYLARARNTCGIGTYGAGIDGTLRSISACP